MIDLLKKLCEINGTSGDEARVADFITDNIAPKNAVIRRDSLGNILVFKKGKNTPQKVIMFAAHMDEVGFIVTDITKSGFLKFSVVGGITPDVVFGRRVKFNNGVTGVIAGKPVHLLNKKESDIQPKTDDLFIDICAADKAESEKHISPGDFCYFTNGFDELNNDIIRAKAVDDRLGCAIMLDMLKSELEYDCVFAFTVQEEIGCRGAAAAAFNLEPDICIVLEATTACDIAGVSDNEAVCRLYDGPVISFMDKGTIYDRELYDITMKTAKENGLKAQTKSRIVGGNDGGVIHKTVGGIRTIAISAPCRYIHSPFCIVSKNDIHEMRVLVDKLLCKFAIL
ncbi:MAG: M42 family peptidase [Oscillospiraceae bacterium]|nr:M42 family peptidase [Oscillospiraceae bacterium]